MIEHFKQGGHPAFRGTSAVNRGILRRKERKKYETFRSGISKH